MTATIPCGGCSIQAGQYVERDDVHYGVKPKHVVAFSTWPGEGCEEANFGLCLYPGVLKIADPRTGHDRRLRTGLTGWCWSSFCKTQYARPGTAGATSFAAISASSGCSTMPSSSASSRRVSDEGDYWEKRDMRALAQEVGEWNELIAAQAGRLKDLLGDKVEAPIAEFPDFEHWRQGDRSVAKPKFALGQVLATPGVLRALEEAGQSPEFFLDRHQVGDWGEVCDEDKGLNDQALVDGSRLLSAYRTLKGVRIWIITEAADDEGRRVSSTILKPDEY